MLKLAGKKGYNFYSTRVYFWNGKQDAASSAFLAWYKEVKVLLVKWILIRWRAGKFSPPSPTHIFSSARDDPGVNIQGSKLWVKKESSGYSSYRRRKKIIIGILHSTREELSGRLLAEVFSLCPCGPDPELMENNKKTSSEFNGLWVMLYKIWD